MTKMAEEISVIIGSSFAAPIVDFDETLEELEYIIKQRMFLYYRGYMNANSTLWGYSDANCRRETLSEILITKRGKLANIENTESN